MKRTLTIIAAALLACTALTAQPSGTPPEGQTPPEGRPEGGRGQRGGAMRELTMSPEEIANLHTQEMIEQFGLSEDQAEQVRLLNLKYVGKVSLPGLRAISEEDRANMPSPEEMREMTREQMRERMGSMQEMQERAAKMQENNELYDTELLRILDKNQAKVYKKEKRRRENEERLRAEAQFRNMMGRGGPGGPGGPGGFGGGPRF